MSSEEIGKIGIKVAQQFSTKEVHSKEETKCLLPIQVGRFWFCFWYVLSKTFKKWYERGNVDKYGMA